MLSTLHLQNLQSALDVPSSTPRLRASVLARTVSQHETDRRLTNVMIQNNKLETV